jgi:predicted ATPase with chaperone activity
MTAPRTVEETGVRRKVLEDLALKTLFVLGELTLRELADHMRIGMPVVDELFQRMRKEQLCQVTGMAAGVHRVVTSDAGKNRALELLALSQYTGAAPVSFEAYTERVHAQTVRHLNVDAALVAQAFHRLVLEDRVLTQLGTAVVSGKAIFLYGPPGTGKTSVAEALWHLFGNDPISVPHAVEVEGQIITVFDPHLHRPSDETRSEDNDPRWVLCHRPRVVVGGELTIDMLDLQYNPSTKFYTAPVQMKANNGLLIIDDFGRQRVRPDELLNRWVVPLDRMIDFLTLTGGKKLEIPFDVLVVFATNIDPAKLVDEAFLRRIQTKIKLDNVTDEQFHEICKRVCADQKLEYQAPIIDQLIDLITRDLQQPLRPCYPRDVIHQICWGARYEKKVPRLDHDSIVQACRTYFLTPT